MIVSFLWAWFEGGVRRKGAAWDERLVGVALKYLYLPSAWFAAEGAYFM